MAKRKTRKRVETVTIRGGGKKPISFRKGALHRALGVPQGQPIPPGKKRAALAGRYGKKVKKMAVFGFRGALAQGRRTAAISRRRK
jgi:hypothetical protein